MKQKKLTQKEFFEVLRQADCVGYDYEVILNCLIIFFRHQAREEEKLGFKVISKMAREKAEFLFDFLNARGFYG